MATQTQSIQTLVTQIVVKNKVVQIEIFIEDPTTKLCEFDKYLVEEVARILTRPKDEKEEKQLLEHRGPVIYRLTYYKVYAQTDSIPFDDVLTAIPTPDDYIEQIEITDEGGDVAAWGLIITRLGDNVIEAFDIVLQTRNHEIVVMQLR